MSTHHDDSDTETSATGRVVLLAFIGLAALATLVALIGLWPGGGQHGHNPQEDEGGAVDYVNAVVIERLPDCPPGEQPVTSTATCNRLVTELDSGKRVTVPIPPATAASEVGEGDRVLLVHTGTVYAFHQPQRAGPILWLTAGFIVLVAFVARGRGLRALVGVAVGGIVLAKFTFPALMEGGGGTVIALVTCSAIMLVVLYLAHGLSIRTSAALAGTLVGIGVTAVIGVLATRVTMLTGVPDEDGATLVNVADRLQPRDLLTCGIIIAGLGVLNDVTITQASAVWELRGADPTMSRPDLMAAGMRIGRDHIASTIYTIVFAYAGAALPILLLLSLYDRPALELMQSEGIATEVVSTLASAFGLVLAVPITTAISAWTVAPVVHD